MKLGENGWYFVVGMLLVGLLAAALFAINVINVGLQEAVATDDDQASLVLAVALIPTSIVVLFAEAIRTRGRCCCDCSDK